ncbi:acidic leucine-rich nuclear phosphoprotein 32 family member A-like isoform X3 [Vespa mandarinia]|uniref:acidic leucine-rich nuclear phosphoprotein 32 family member A-like isoform X2 n=1 Tax=Vespa mandarinia TaxID=7446 RepID=UPI00160924B7|nr:acidic leucine-rich nuclear phosphoprotein 32 family member A-like isoform X2 [Vespa mandarinia]XP_035721886.1 acidic leucine-rich nuclear phosphoprotein 32 family member A-like isoform X3 [Vespa mandarinia]
MGRRKRHRAHADSLTKQRRVPAVCFSLFLVPIKELVLDNCRSTYIDGLTDEFVALEVLSLINVGLTSLKGFPKLPNLKKLELSDNRISGGINLLHMSPKIDYLNLSGNKIKDIDTLQPLKEFKNLKYLDLFNNEVTNVDNYREKVFSLVPNLRYLDGFDRDDCEAEDSEDDEVNGNEDGDGEVNEEDSEEGSDEESGYIPGDLASVYKYTYEDDDSDEEDYMGEEEEEEDDDYDIVEVEVEEEEEEEEEASPARGKKRKHEDVESGN